MYQLADPGFRVELGDTVTLWWSDGDPRGLYWPPLEVTLTDAATVEVINRQYGREHWPRAAHKATLTG